jgi:NAD(P)-dependent dehydrogenase (short-subunit alcohol dehydrogenase family)
MRFQNQVVIVTGSGRGIGRATARAFAAEGGRVVIAERDAELAEETLAEIVANGGEGRVILTDVMSRASVATTVAQTIAEFGAIDVLVNNVGGGPGSNLIDISDADWEFGIRMNLYSTFYCSVTVAPHMIERGHGKIVNISSSAARFMSRYFATLAYVAAKGGVSALTRQLGWLLGPQGINVNAVEPGHVMTELTREQWPTFSAETRDEIMRELPMGRMADPSEIAQAVLFLASADADYMQGSAVEVNGGLWMS